MFTLLWNFSFCKWENIEKVIKPSGHTGVNVVVVAAAAVIDVVDVDVVVVVVAAVVAAVVDVVVVCLTIPCKYYLRLPFPDLLNSPRQA